MDDDDCPECDSDNTEMVYAISRDMTGYADTQLRQCKDCKTVYTWEYD
jgi:hypothetical protein